MAEKIRLVSLGDSVATGTLTPFSSTYSYVFYLQKKLRAMGFLPFVYNLAHDGDTSRDLLRKLSGSAQYSGVVAGADMITVSIGGNDLLKACSVPGFARIDEALASKGADRFARNWPQIAGRLRSVNPNAELIVLNIYNPYDSTRHDRRLCGLADRYLAPINEAIAAHAEGRYTVVDTYAAFKRFSDGKMYKVSSLYPESLLRNPHPTPAAQRLIAGLILDEIDTAGMIQRKR